MLSVKGTFLAKNGLILGKSPGRLLGETSLGRGQWGPRARCPDWEEWRAVYPNGVGDGTRKGVEEGEVATNYSGRGRE